MRDTTIGKYRDDIGYSQQTLAGKLNVTRTTMSFYETKKFLPTLEVAEKLAGILGKTVGQLYTEDELRLIK